MGRGHSQTNKHLSTAETLFKKRIGDPEDNDPCFEGFSLSKRKHNLKKALKTLEEFDSYADQFQDSEGYLLSSTTQETVACLKNIISKNKYKYTPGDKDWEDLQKNIKKELQFFPKAAEALVLIRPFIFGPKEGLYENGLFYLSNKAYPRKIIIAVNNLAVLGTDLFTDPLKAQFPGLNTDNVLKSLVEDGYFEIEQQVHSQDGEGLRKNILKAREKFIKIRPYIVDQEHKNG